MSDPIEMVNTLNFLAFSARTRYQDDITLIAEGEFHGLHVA